MTPVSASFARRQAEARGLDRIVILQIDAETGQPAITTWGKSRAICRELKAWAEGPGGDRIMQEIGDARP